MTYVQVSEVIAEAQRFHRELRKKIRAAAHAASSSPRLQMLAMRIARQEEQVRSALETYSPKTQKDILQTWLKNLPEIDLRTPVEQLELEPGMTPQAFVVAVLEADRALLRLFEALVPLARTEDVRELFERLALQERALRQSHHLQALSAEGI